MEWVKLEGAGEYAAIRFGGQFVWTAVIVTNGKSWLSCIVQGAPREGADVLWPSDPGAATYYSSDAEAKRAAEGVLAQWARDLIGVANPPTMRWASVDESGRMKGRLDRGGIDVEVACTAYGDWIAKVNGKELQHDGAARLFPSAVAAQIGAEVAARSMWSS
jgi:hypothetical protein